MRSQRIWYAGSVNILRQQSSFRKRSIRRSSRCWTALIYRQKFMKEVQVIHWRPEAAAAAAAAAYRLGLTDPKMIVQMPEGTMEVEIREDGEIFLTGDVGYVGSISLGSYFTEQLKLV